MKTRSYSSILVITLFALAISAPVLAQDQRQIGDGVTAKVAGKQRPGLHHWTSPGFVDT